MKVAHLIPWMGVGGAEQVVLNLCKYGNRSEVEQFVVSLSDGPMISEIEATGAPVFVATTAKKIVSHLRKADLVNLHWCKYDKNIYTVVLASLVPHVTTLHWPSTLPDLSNIAICTSRYAKEVQEDPSKFVVVSNGIDLASFYHRPRLPKEKTILVRVCRPTKCADYFLEAMDRILEDCKSAELWIVGEEGKSTERIKYLGIRRDVPEILSQADIFVYIPRPKAGTRDLVIMEAMAMGLPCVVSDVRTARASITHLHNGVLVPFGDVGAFAEATVALIENSQLREKLREEAIDTARREFDVTKKVLQYEKIYRFALRSSASASVDLFTGDNSPLAEI